MFKLKLGEQIHVNDKWFMDVMSHDKDKKTVQLQARSGDTKYDLIVPVAWLKMEGRVKDVRSNTTYLSIGIDEDKLRDMLGDTLDKIDTSGKPVNENALITKFTDFVATTFIKEDGESVGPGFVSPGTAEPGVPGSPGNVIAVGNVKNYLDFRKRNANKELVDYRHSKKHMRSIKRMRKTKPDNGDAPNGDYFGSKVYNVVESSDEVKTKLYSILDRPRNSNEDLSFIKLLNDVRVTFLTATTSEIVQSIDKIKQNNIGLYENTTDEMKSDLQTVLDLAKEN